MISIVKSLSLYFSFLCLPALIDCHLLLWELKLSWHESAQTRTLLTRWATTSLVLTSTLPIMNLTALETACMCAYCSCVHYILCSFCHYLLMVHHFKMQNHSSRLHNIAISTYTNVFAHTRICAPLHNIYITEEI